MKQRRITFLQPREEKELRFLNVLNRIISIFKAITMRARIYSSDSATRLKRSCPVFPFVFNRQIRTDSFSKNLREEGAADDASRMKRKKIKTKKKLKKTKKENKEALTVRMSESSCHPKAATRFKDSQVEVSTSFSFFLHTIRFCSFDKR